MSDDKSNEASAASETRGAASEPTAAKPAPDKPKQYSTQSGPTFEKGSDPLAGVKKGASDAMASMEGKTVSMKVYVGSIVGVIVLMLLARCGG
ncbi:MAG: hypothetical protein WBN23_11460 [Woeseia sp.]